jgi:CheY-like chemotaxis protein
MARILLIDDEEDLREAISLALQYHGHEVTQAATGRVVFGLSERAQAAPFDLIITDIVMPDVEGLETIIAARAALPGTKIIAMSGTRAVRGLQPEYLRLAERLGADGTLFKPFSTAELFRLVETTLQAA